MILLDCFFRTDKIEILKSQPCKLRALRLEQWYFRLQSCSVFFNCPLNDICQAMSDSAGCTRIASTNWTTGQLQIPADMIINWGQAEERFLGLAFTEHTELKTYHPAEAVQLACLHQFESVSIWFKASCDLPGSEQRCCRMLSTPHLCIVWDAHLETWQCNVFFVFWVFLRLCTD